MCTYSRPPNTADLGTDEKAAVFGNRRYWESYITYKTLIWDLEMGGGIGGDDCMVIGEGPYLQCVLVKQGKVTAANNTSLYYPATEAPA